MAKVSWLYPLPWRTKTTYCMLQLSLIPKGPGVWLQAWPLGSPRMHTSLPSLAGSFPSIHPTFPNNGSLSLILAWSNLPLHSPSQPNHQYFALVNFENYFLYYEYTYTLQRCWPGKAVLNLQMFWEMVAFLINVAILYIFLYICPF